MAGQHVQALRGVKLVPRYIVRGLVLLTLCSSVSSCGLHVWSTRVESPDGTRVVTADAYTNHVGFGSNGVPNTIVQLNYTTGSQKARAIADFGNELETSEGMAVGIKWLSPTKLEITYHQDSQWLGFEAIKYIGVDIEYVALPN